MSDVAQLIIALATFASALASVIVAIRTSSKVSSTHELVNGASKQIGVLLEERGHAAGLAEAAATDKTPRRRRPPPA